MNKVFIGLMLGASLFVGACGNSSGNDAKDNCTEDPNLPECLQNKEQEEPQNEEPDEQEQSGAEL